jgi:histidinol-phosphatase (PHP family)
MARNCERALALGVPAVAFTDHLDFTRPADGDLAVTEGLDSYRYRAMQSLDIEGYLAAIEDCRQRYPGLRILSGAEIGEPHLFDASASAVATSAGFDRILGSLHAVPVNGRLTAADALFGTMTADEVMRRYFAELVRVVEGSDVFEVLAHLDFPRRYWPASAGRYEEKAYEAEYREVLRALAASGRVLELNTKSPMASVELLRWWRDCGGTAVSFGSDAHQAWRVAEKFKEAIAVAEAAGFAPGRDEFDFWRRSSLLISYSNRSITLRT